MILQAPHWSTLSSNPSQERSPASTFQRKLVNLAWILSQSWELERNLAYNGDPDSKHLFTLKRLSPVLKKLKRTII